jgi:hypothetical protein
MQAPAGQTDLHQRCKSKLKPKQTCIVDAGVVQTIEPASMMQTYQNTQMSLLSAIKKTLIFSKTTLFFDTNLLILQFQC